MQRTRLLCKLNSFTGSSVIFYQCFIESLLSFSFIRWFQRLTAKDRDRLNIIVKTCSKTDGVKQRAKFFLLLSDSLKKEQLFWPLLDVFSLLSPGRHYVLKLTELTKLLQQITHSGINYTVLN